MRRRLALLGKVSAHVIGRDVVHRDRRGVGFDVRLKFAGKLLVFGDGVVRQIRLCVRQPRIKVFGDGFFPLRRLAGDGRNEVRSHRFGRVRLFDQIQPGKLRVGNFPLGGFERLPNQLAVCTPANPPGRTAFVNPCHVRFGVPFGTRTGLEQSYTVRSLCASQKCSLPFTMRIC